MENELDWWRIVDDLAVIDAAILITGNNPSNKETVYDVQEGITIFNSDGTEAKRQVIDYPNFEPVFKSLRNAILRNKLRATIAFQARTEIPYSDAHSMTGEPIYQTLPYVDLEYEVEVKYHGLLRAKDFKTSLHLGSPFDAVKNSESVWIHNEPDWTQSTVDVDDLKDWLDAKGFFPAFFFPKGAAGGFRDKQHPRYSPKLACAIAAWENVERPLKNMSVKESVASWVQSNGVNYGMADESGVIPNKAVEQVATVVNWNTKGGANPTWAPDEDTLKQEIENFDKRQDEPDDPVEELPF
jgi:hypothetical protein